MKTLSKVQSRTEQLLGCRAERVSGCTEKNTNLSLTTGLFIVITHTLML